MRWPLKNQIMARTCLLLFVTIVALTFANIRSAISTNREVELDSLGRLVELMTTTRFPLTSSVLEDMKSLSKAEFVLTEGDSTIVSRTSVAPAIESLNLSSGMRYMGPVQNTMAATSIVSNEQSYYHTSVQVLQSLNQTSQAGELHIFVPRRSNQSVWWRASKSPLTIAMLILPLAFLVSVAMASQVTRPLAKLEQQVKQIAQGDLQQIPQVDGNNEIQSLHRSINQMAVKLQDHDNQLLRNERLRTMVQFGSGIAHHLRNSATGCKMAIELLGIEHDGMTESDNYQVALRQLGLMDNYVKKFLLLAKSPESKHVEEATERIDLKEVLENVVFLLSPSAKHLNVELKVETDCDKSTFRMSIEDAEQLMMNLITNAIAAASIANPTRQVGEQRSIRKATVAVMLVVDRTGASFQVTDTGAGPSKEIANSIFQPFVTGSKEGTGLGLSLVSEIASRVDGTVKWERKNNTTVFRFDAKHQSNESNSIQ